MAKIRSRGNSTTELAMVALLRQSGLSGWRRHPALPGRPDFAFKSAHVAVFVDGCFWHGCPKCYRPPEGNRAYWEAKVTRNRHRDSSVAVELRARGWSVLRIWEHSLKSAESRKRTVTRLRRATLRVSAGSDAR